ncbi:hypothetical protein [Alkalihalobacillus pseudalcaliphilus]|uniref:hypothetical protein n=1 Tax=Alkalihalobacillus pseudalcaliphilus TaxID=79884 RepID=UPI00064DA823|nr:hypothetical protein [Alkalihalobacillus pseudalcaliphilus]KMK76582.1 hypothetical protein AB990_15565 [Alkalihalobacillus pseudalcaliphilus]
MKRMALAIMLSICLFQLAFSPYTEIIWHQTSHNYLDVDRIVADDPGKTPHFFGDDNEKSSHYTSALLLNVLVILFIHGIAFVFTTRKGWLYPKLFQSNYLKESPFLQSNYL